MPVQRKKEEKEKDAAAAASKRQPPKDCSTPKDRSAPEDQTTQPPLAPTLPTWTPTKIARKKLTTSIAADTPEDLNVAAASSTSEYHTYSRWTV